jgi:methylenetetrahydrofolate--tRNA-(uracil-5-)-methyltransferase
MNVNFGLFPPVEPEITPNGKRRKLKGRDRKAAMAGRALRDLDSWIAGDRLAAE